MEVRFLLGTPVGASKSAAAALEREAREHNDTIFLPMQDSRFSCARKPLLWYAHCSAAFPSARFYALADDDSYVHFERLLLDMRMVASYSQDGSEEHVLYGMIMWYGVYDNLTMVTHNAWGGWQNLDAGAVHMRRRVDRCRSDPSMPSCDRLPPWARDLVKRGGLGDMPPWPVANGPLFAVSRVLGRLLVDHPTPRTYLDALHRTPRVQSALTRPGGPRKSNYGCWPVYDSVLGFWIAQVTASRNVSVRLVDTPGMVQHHPWPATVKGAFSNTSIVMHGIKTDKPRMKAVLALIEQRTNATFVPFHRKCGTCADMGWSSWPGSRQNNWLCCGCDTVKESRRKCLKRTGKA
jgi:hypothetical protein